MAILFSGTPLRQQLFLTLPAISALPRLSCRSEHGGPECDCTFRRTANQRNVFGEDSGLVSRRRRSPGLQAIRDGFGRYIQVNRAFFDIDANGVAFLNCCDRPANGGLRCDVSDHEPASGPAETAIGQKSHSLTEASAHLCTG